MSTCRILPVAVDALLCAAAAENESLGVTVSIAPGPVGSEANFDTGPINITADGNGSTSVLVDFLPQGIDPDDPMTPFTFTSTFNWSVAAPNADFGGFYTLFEYFVGFPFSHDPPEVVSRTDTSYSRSFDKPLVELVEGYYASIHNLPPDETLVFQLTGQGALVVPEPAAFRLLICGALTLAGLRRNHF